MEDLFSTTITVEGQPVAYKVLFSDEAYFFQPIEPGTAGKTFSLKREADAWQSQQKLPEALEQQAVEALERYLLQQH